jgi:hypothetical protein
LFGLPSNSAAFGGKIELNSARARYQWACKPDIYDFQAEM